MQPIYALIKNVPHPKLGAGHFLSDINGIIIKEDLVLLDVDISTTSLEILLNELILKMKDNLEEKNEK